MKLCFFERQYYCQYCFAIKELEKLVAFKTNEVECLQKALSADSVQMHFTKLDEIIYNFTLASEHYQENTNQNIKLLAGEIKRERLRLRGLEKTLNST